MAYADLAPTLNGLGITEEEVLNLTPTPPPALTKAKALEILTESDDPTTSNNAYDIAIKVCSCSVDQVQTVQREALFTRDPSAAVVE